MSSIIMSINMKNIQKKYIIIGGAVIIVIAIIFLVVFLLRNNLKYPEEPLNQQSLSKDTREISLGKTQIQTTGDYQIFQVSTELKYSFVNDFAKVLDLKLSSSSEGEYYKWTSSRGSIFYDINKNIVIFELNEGIEWNEAEMTDTSFNRFSQTYFGENWKYKVSGSEKRTGGDTVFYANRYIDGQNIVEMREHNQQTDMIALKDGKIVSGKLLMTKFTPMNYKVPLISEDTLRNNLAQSNYQKEIYPQFSSLQDTILQKVNYLSNDFEEVADSLKNCTSTDSSVIYYYKSFDQSLITPVYKLALQCDISYNKVIYSVPAIGYVNAIESQYLSVPE